ncbi:MAG: CpaF family protein [Candidatus Sericytochromatia bacterium]|nr:CpaF family protein [Candidatus Sericytochromatia bacterium]
MSRPVLAADLLAQAHKRLLVLLREQGQEHDPPADILEHVARRAVRDVLGARPADLPLMVQLLLAEVRGLGPLDALMGDPAVSEIMVNGPSTVWVERGGQIERTSLRFHDEAHLRRIIDRIVQRVGRRVDEATPMADARLPDGSRVNVILPPLALDGPVLTIRRFRATPPDAAELLAQGAWTTEVEAFLAAAVRARCNILVSGGTGTGKTTLLNVLSRYIPDRERLITIEDAAELRLQQPHVVRLETRPGAPGGLGRVDQAELLRNSLRMRPDRILLGEVRGAEALTMLQAMNTGHEGSLATLHANAPRDALARLETMVLMSGAELPLRAIREQVARAVDLVVQVARWPGGSRGVASVVEVLGMEGDTVTMQELFRRPEGVDAPMALQDCGLVPRVAARLREVGWSRPVAGPGGRGPRW